MFEWFVIIAVIVVIVVLVSTGSYHLWLRVPYVPTPIVVVQKMIALAQLQGDETVFDLGAGDGRLLIEAKKRCPGITAIGYELVPFVWLLGYVRIKRAHQNIEWLRCDALKADLRNANVIFLYMTPNILHKMSEKFVKQLRPGTRIISHAFKLPGKTPVMEDVVMRGGTKATVRVYLWE